jgi:hypothetical protein
MANTTEPEPEFAKNDLHVSASNQSSKDIEPHVLEGHTEHLPTYEHEKALCWKFDIRILPMLALMYLCNALDKGNLGNAKTDGMDKDLGFVGNQYNIMLSIFFIPYVLFAPPIGMLGKKYGPHRVLPIMMFSFGSATLLSACVVNFGGMMALRWFLGKSNFITLYAKCSSSRCMNRTSRQDDSSNIVQEWRNPLSSHLSSTI